MVEPDNLVFRNVPMQTSIACGDSHSLAVAAGGGLYSWGKAYAGRCGIAEVSGMPTDDDVPYQPIPRQVVGCGFADRKVTGVASGRWHNLAIVDDGDLYAWGAADAGRCGFSDTSNMPRDEDNWPYQPIPRQVGGGALEGRKILAIACGENHSLVVTTMGELVAWGSLHMGRCGFPDVSGLPTDDENHPYQPVPRRVMGGAFEDRRVVSVACGTFHSLAVTDVGELFSWGSACAGRCGYADLSGLPIDHDGVQYQPVPRQVVDGGMKGRTIASVACSEGHSFAITVTGELYAWGNADAGRCGIADVDSMPVDSDGPFQPVPARVAEELLGNRVMSVACGSWHSLAVTQEGGLYAWGAARAGRCGFADVSGLPADENGPYQPSPRQVVDGGIRGKRVKSVACGSWHSLAVTDDGDLYAWGVALMSRCGFDTVGMPIDDLCPYQPTPLAVVAMPRVKLGSAAPPIVQGAEAVCADLRELLQSESYADVCFDVGGTELRAHVAILVARCDHFRRMFRSGMAECRVDLVDNNVGSGCIGSAAGDAGALPTRRVCITDCGAVAFGQLLLWLYTGSLEPGLPTEELASILKLSDVYRLPALRLDCERLLSSHIDVECVTALLQVAIAAQASELEGACLNFAIEHSSAVMGQSSYKDCKDVEVMRRLASAWSAELGRVREKHALLTSGPA